MLIAEFFVPGPPIAKGRPRVALRAGRPVAYTPDRTARYESTVALIGAQAMDGSSPIAEPVELSVRAFFPIPQSWPKARRAAAIPANDREIWLRVGMALHNDVGGQAGFELWCRWSSTSPKFNPVGCGSCRLSPRADRAMMRATTCRRDTHR